MMATESYLQMADSLYEADWQHLPVEMQKYFIPMMANAQLSLCYSGFGMITLNLETFKKVSDSSFGNVLEISTLIPLFSIIFS